MHPKERGGGRASSESDGVCSLLHQVFDLAVADEFGTFRFHE
jgi:hypothetical protein